MGGLNKNDNEESFTSTLIGLVFIFIIGLIPAICRLKVVPVDNLESQFLRTATSINDIFSYNKAVAVVVASIIILIFFVMDIATEGSKFEINFKQPQIIAIGVYALMTIVSLIFSKYKGVSFNGIGERYEGIWVLLSYVVFFLTSQLFVRSQKSLNFIVIGVFISALIVGGVGLFQFLGKDIFKTDFGAKFVLGSYYTPGKLLVIKFEDIYSTLYNPNCAGLYSALLTPFFLVLTIVLKFRNPLKYISAIFTILMGINLVGSSSAGGVIGFMASLGVLVILFIVDIIYNRRLAQKPLVYGGALGVIVLVAVIGIGSITISNPIKVKFNNVISAVVNKEGNTGYTYKSFAVEGNKAIIGIANGELKIVYTGNDAKLFGTDGNEIKPSQTEPIPNGVGRIYKFDSVENLGGECQLQYTNDIIVFTDGKIQFMVKVDGNRLKALTKKNEVAPNKEDIKSMVFTNYPYLATGRGFIWSRSIPVALKHFFIGSGPDTFSFVFPQNDVYSKTSVLGNPYIIVDKPHSMFLQVAINTGGISLVALLVVFVYYIIRSFKKIIKNNSSNYILAVRIAILGAVCGYLVAGLATDSVVSVAPVFWTLLGTGFAINEL